MMDFNKTSKKKKFVGVVCPKCKKKWDFCHCCHPKIGAPK